MNLFSFIKSKVSITTVVNEYVTLKKAGYYLKGNCPFHSEKTASFTVSPHKEIFYCFGCNEGGDVITFISKIENCSQLEAAQHLAQHYQIDIPDELAQKPGSAKNQQIKKHYFDLCKEVAHWCHEKLLKSPDALAYLKNRKFTKESIQRFKIGYFPGGPYAIKTFITQIQKANFLTADLLEAHILQQGKNIFYSPFEERIIFPIKDHIGRYCGFGGRIFKEHDERAKYYNSRENEFFTKGSLLFGLALAKKEIQKHDIAYMVEGYTDCIALAQHGYTNTIATLGTACTSQHLKLLARYTQRLYILYDGDPAGQKAIIRLTELCWDVNLELKVISFPRDEDPASFCARSGDIQELMSQAQDIFSFFIQTMGAQFATKTLNEKLQLTQKIIDMIAHVHEPFKREFLLTQAAQTLHVPITMIKEELKRSHPQKQATSITMANDQESWQEIPKIEQRLFAALASDFNLIEKISSGYVIDYVHAPVQKLIRQLIMLRQEKKGLTFIEFFDSLEPHDQKLANRMLLESEGDSTSFNYLLEKFHKKHWKVIANDVKEKLQAAQLAGDNEKVAHIITQFQELKKNYVKGTYYGTSTQKNNEN